MNTSVLSIRDYFNYYFAGLAWLLVIAAAFLPQTGSIQRELNIVKAIMDSLGTPLAVAYVLFVPYLLGFALSGLALLVTQLALHYLGDPQCLVIDPYDYEHRVRWGWISPLLCWKWIGDDTIASVAEGIRNELRNLPADPDPPLRSAKPDPKYAEPVCVRESNQQLGRMADRRYLKKRFGVLRTYVRNSGLPSAEVANRNRLLANLAEGLLVPVPFTFAVLAIALPFGQAPLRPRSDVELLLLATAAGLGLLLLHLYLYSREYEAKHVYWTFATGLLGRR